MFQNILFTLDGLQQVLPAALMAEFTRYEALDLINRPRPNLSGCDLSGLSLPMQAFGDARLFEVDFSGCDLRNADFRGARVIGCNFAGANLDGVQIRDARVADCNFDGASAVDSGFAAYLPQAQPVTADA